MTIEINQTITIFLAILLLALGGVIVKNVKLFKIFCIPAPVVEGLLFAHPQLELAIEDRLITRS
ncbi:sodium/glutamate symporter [Peribacillus butanolivorans]|uniref:sodium/glutamate symporter n=1 Tax=Peribacillus butanolivorans TaxID=421767 RepID=UPI002E2034BD|nr:sodium/glutamate symporter [Peribacillus butanolivorans]MED3692085.1 sodium/glutamate symporter [Peribacillus butanolivorans]